MSDINKVIIAGSINMDCVASVISIPRPGETVSGSALNYYPGGKGANQAVAAARLDAQTYMIGCIGNDGFGDTLRDFLSQQGMNINGVRTSQTLPTGTAFITVDQDGENAITVIAGSNSELSPDDIKRISMTDGDILIAQNETPIPVTEIFFNAGKTNGATTIYNPAPAIKAPQSLLALADIIIVNETELAFYAGGADAIKNIEDAQESEICTLAKTLIQRDDQTILVTLGSKGAVIIQNDETIRIAGQKVAAIDTTGAGDCFVGALACALSKGLDITNAAHYANQAAGLAVQKNGAGAGMPYASELPKLSHS